MSFLKRLDLLLSFRMDGTACPLSESPTAGPYRANSMRNRFDAGRDKARSRFVLFVSERHALRNVFGLLMGMGVELKRVVPVEKVYLRVVDAGSGEKVLNPNSSDSRRFRLVNKRFAVIGSHRADFSGRGFDQRPMPAVGQQFGQAGIDLGKMAFSDVQSHVCSPLHFALHVAKRLVFGAMDFIAHPLLSLRIRSTFFGL